MRVRVQRAGRGPDLRRSSIENDRHHPLFATSSEDGDDADRRVTSAGDEATFAVDVRQRARARAASTRRRGSSHDGGAPIVDRRERARVGDRHRPCTARAGRRPPARRCSYERATSGGRAMSSRAASPRPIAGPVGARRRARGASPTWRCTLAVTDFKLRFFGSVLGYLWQLVRPLLLFGVLYVVFTQFVQARRAASRSIPSCCCSTSCSSRSSPRPRRRGRVAGRPREPRAQDPVPARSRSRSRSCSPRRSTSAQHRRRARASRSPSGVRAALDVARAAAPARRARRARRSASRCCCRRSTSASATSSRSGTSSLQVLFYATPIIYAIETIDVARDGSDSC